MGARRDRAPSHHSDHGHAQIPRPPPCPRDRDVVAAEHHRVRRRPGAPREPGPLHPRAVRRRRERSSSSTTSSAIDQPLLTRYWDWLSGFFQGDLGTSYVYSAPVSDFIGDALLNSFKLAVVALIIVIPVSVVGGVIAAMRVGGGVDRSITITGLSPRLFPSS